jgi:hypothetical protein
MNKKRLVVIVIVVVVLVLAAWLGGDAVWRLLRLMHGGH